MSFTAGQRGRITVIALIQRITLSHHSQSSASREKRHHHQKPVQELEKPLTEKQLSDLSEYFFVFVLLRVQNNKAQERKVLRKGFEIVERDANELRGGI